MWIWNVARGKLLQKTSFHVVVINEVESMQKNDVAIKNNFLINLFNQNNPPLFPRNLIKIIYRCNYRKIFLQQQEINISKVWRIKIVA